MKTAFLLLCHKNPEQINILLQKLLECDCDIYVHIDLKNNDIRSEISNNNRISILNEKDSYSIEWGGVTMIQATLSLINAVYNSSKKYDYLCLLSGQDFPIRSMKDYQLLLDGNNFIEVIERNTKDYDQYKKRCELHYPVWINNKSVFIKAVKRLYMLITGGYSYTFPILRRKKTFSFEFEFGSQWWCLTYECAMYMLEYCKIHPEYIDFFKTVIVPDECFFQILFMASPFRNTQKNNLTYINWNRKINRRSPLIFTNKDFDLLQKISENFCFARKFDINIDSPIVERLSKL